APVAPPVVNTPVAVKKPAPPPPVPEPSFWQELMNSVDSTILGGVGAVALLGGGWMFLRNKRRKDLDSFERGILTSGGLRANTVFGNTTGNASNSDSSFLTDFAQSADGNMIDTNDVDPIAEAEVYMAYGRDAQAEEILKDAISKEPKRYELHLKLLEMYAARKDTSAFEAIAGELYTTLGANDPVWAKVAEIGHNMEPENPLYDVTQAGVASSLAMQDLGISDAAKAPINDLDFSLDHDANSVLTQDFSDVKKDEHEALFDLGSIKDAHLDDSAPLNSLAADNNTIDFSSEKDSSIDFDLGEFNMDAELADSHLALDKTVADSVTTDNHFIAPVLDLSSLNSPEVDKTADSNMLDFDMDFSAFTEPKLDTLPDGLAQAVVAPHLVHDTDIHDTGMANDIVFDFDLPSEPHTDAQTPEKSPEISFDLPALDSVEGEHHLLGSSPLKAHSNEFEVNTFDLSTISLDLADAVAEAPATQANVAGIESPDIDIKLDLVAAYIDMDDKEGARELLDEVMKEGGAKQQLRAQQMLASLA
ncbi:MAG: FimV/HubP family polar landmark protein, partial [Pseudomonadota bacterium]